MAELYIYKTEFDPIFLPGEQGLVITENDRFVAECVAVGALPEDIKDFGALTGGAWDTENENTNLEVSDNEMAQFRMRILDPMKIRFNNLSSTRQWRTSKSSFTLSQFPPLEEPDFIKSYMFKASEFFVYKDDTPRFDLYADATLVTSRILFSGWKYRIKRIGTAARPAKVIWVSGWPSGD